MHWHADLAPHIMPEIAALHSKSLLFVEILVVIGEGDRIEASELILLSNRW